MVTNYFLNRKGAKGAKGFFVGLVVILGEKFRITTEPSPDGQILPEIVYHSPDTVFHLERDKGTLAGL